MSCLVERGIKIVGFMLASCGAKWKKLRRRCAEFISGVAGDDQAAIWSKGGGFRDHIPPQVKNTYTTLKDDKDSRARRQKEH